MTRKRKCQKTVNYPTKRKALTGLRNHRPSATGLLPMRVYWCGQHKAYHTTSKSRY